MFTPDVFMITDASVIRAFIRDNGFATLVLVHDGEIVIDHVPLVLAEDGQGFGVLRGHVAKANGLCRLDLADSTPAVAIFQGPHAYVSANHYPSKHEHGRMVPTWNYTVAHARGPVRLVDDAAWLRDQMSELTGVYESHRADPWHIDDAPADYIERLSRGVVGVEMRVRSVQCKWKLSQNQAAADFEGVIAGLTGEGRDDVVDYMRRTRPRG